jgi:hypothetical protein
VIPPTGEILQNADHHADARGAKADMPVHALAEITAHQRRDERTEVDPHVVDREAGIAACVLRPVQRTDDHRGVALQEAGPEHDQREADVEAGE